MKIEIKIFVPKLAFDWWKERHNHKQIMMDATHFATLTGADVKYEEEIEPSDLPPEEPE